MITPVLHIVILSSLPLPQHTPLAEHLHSQGEQTFLMVKALS